MENKQNMEQSRASQRKYVTKRKHVYLGLILSLPPGKTM